MYRFLSPQEQEEWIEKARQLFRFKMMRARRRRLRREEQERKHDEYMRARIKRLLGDKPVYFTWD